MGSKENNNERTVDSMNDPLEIYVSKFDPLTTSDEVGQFILERTSLQPGSHFKVKRLIKSKKLLMEKPNNHRKIILISS